MMKKVSLAVLGLFTTSGWADQATLEEKIQRISEQNVYCDWQGANKSASVSSGFVFEADFLYWKALVEGLVYGQSLNVNVPTVFPGTITVADDVKDLDFEWDPGFQVGAGYIFEGRQQWAVNALWTYFHSTASDTFSGGNFLTGSGLKPMWLPFLMGSIADKASANWSLNYNVLDFGTGLDFFVGRYVSLRPQLGVRAAWINQDYTAKYAGGFSYNTAGTETILRRDTKFSGSNDYSGAGLRFGSDVKLFLTKNLLVQGGGFFSLLYGQFEIREFYDGAFLLDIGAGPFLIPETIKLKKDFNAVKPNLETELGATWQMFMHNDRYRLSLGAFYQFVYWFSQNNLVNQLLNGNGGAVSPGSASINTNRDVVNVNPQGDLQMHGLKIQLNLDF